MPQTAAQLIALATQAAACPGYTQQAGQLLNIILSDLCQTYDFNAARKTFYFNFDPGLSATIGNSIFGSGPYPLPADFLRCAGKKSVFWTLQPQGVPYPMVPIDLYEFDEAVQQAGLQTYPYWFCTDVSPNDSVQQGLAGQPVAYVYPPPSGAFPCTVRYYSQMADIVTPEASAVVPWFPNQSYLRTRLTGELFAITDDERAPAYLGDGSLGAQGILRRYLSLEGDKEDRAQTVQLDRRRFGAKYSQLPNTKVIGW